MKLNPKYYKKLILIIQMFISLIYSQNNNDLIYSAKDSIVFDLDNNKVYLYNNAEVEYEDIKLNSFFISIDFEKNILFSKGVNDSLGNYIKKPLLKESSKTYYADTITYNYKTKKAKIKKLLTEEEGGYLHGKDIKKENSKNYFLKHGNYTTCSNENPHFYINAKKLKLISGEKIITGPAKLVINDLPTPLFIPFGIFPIHKKRSSGIILPTYGQSTQLGYNLQNLGYHFSLSEYFNLSLTGDIYSRGSWKLNLLSAYKKKYKYDGNIKINFSKTGVGERELSNYNLTKDFKISWKHKQDQKAHPNNQFSALVNLATSSYLRNNSYDTDYLKNTLSSNISFQRRFNNKPYNLSISLRHNQNTLNKQINITLPELSFTVNRLFPFRRTIKKTWYKNLGINYNLNAKNSITATDSLIFKKINKNLKSGVKHSIPISTSFNLLKHINISPKINYTERWYFNKMERDWDNNIQMLNIDTTNGFWALREFNFSTQISTKIYGLISTKRKQFRHVFTPSINYSYKPDFSQERFGIYSEYENENELQKYSYFEGSIYGFPGQNTQNMLNINLNNNLEMKIHSEEGEKKIKIIDNLSLSGAYNNALDSLKMSNIYINLRTNLFNKVNFKANAMIDPYALNKQGVKLNQFMISNGKIGRLTKLNFNLSLNLNNKKSNSTKTHQDSDYFIDFNVPWSLNFFYSFTYSKPMLEYEIIQSVNFNGNIKISEKWKIGFRSGYDIKNRDFTYTTFDIYRDLHCWEMSFNWIPLGFRQSYNFIIKVKSSILQDLKIAKRKDRFDY